MLIEPLDGAGSPKSKVTHRGLRYLTISIGASDAVWSVAFDWVPYVQENAVYRVLATSEITVEPALSA